MLIAGTDLETTGLEINSLSITEVSAVLWDTNRKLPMRMFSSLVKLPDGVRIPAPVQALNGITDNDCAVYGRELGQVLGQAGAEVFHHADVIVAHNWADFDGPILKRFVPPSAFPRIAIDTSVDVPYPETVTTRKLAYLCAEHGFVNPFPHHGLTDTLSMLVLLSHYPIEKVLEIARSPMLKVRALVDYEDRDKAKARGYRWDSERSIWTKNIREIHFQGEQHDAPFMVQLL